MLGESLISFPPHSPTSFRKMGHFKGSCVLETNASLRT